MKICASFSRNFLLSEIQQLKTIKWPRCPSNTSASILQQKWSSIRNLIPSPLTLPLICQGFFVCFFCFVLFCFCFVFFKLPTDTGQPNYTLLGNGVAVLRELGGTNPRLSLKAVPRSPEKHRSFVRRWKNITSNQECTLHWFLWILVCIAPHIHELSHLGDENEWVHGLHPSLLNLARIFKHHFFLNLSVTHSS